MPVGSHARLLSNDVLAGWLIENVPFRLQLASVFPFYPIAGSSLRYATTPALQPAATIGFDDPVPEDTKYPDDRQRSFGLAEIATRFQVAYAAQDIFSSNVNDQTAVQMALAIRELLYRFWIMFESGSADQPGQFDGLANLVDPTNVVELDGRPLTLESLDAAKERVRANDGRGLVAFTNSVGKRAINAAHWTRGLHPGSEWMMVPGGRSDDDGERVLCFDGAPVYVSDLNRRVEGEDEGELTDIWFFVMGENNLHGITPASLGDAMFVTRETIDADGSATTFHVTMPVGLALGSASALSVVRNASLPATP